MELWDILLLQTANHLKVSKDLYPTIIVFYQLLKLGHTDLYLNISPCI